ncbi:heme-dependent oxidative N-demethylase family protein [Haliea atlantica]
MVEAANAWIPSQFAGPFFCVMLPDDLPLPDAAILKMGLAPLDASTWILPARDASSWLKHKQSVRSRLGERAYAVLPVADAAAEELQRILLEHLLTEHGGRWQRGDGCLRIPAQGLVLPVSGAGREALWHASLWVAEDLVLMQADDCGRYRLTAASLCSPSHWQLEDKLGKTLPEIHAPVPGFARELDARVARFFGHLKTARPVQRYNWGLQRGRGRCQRQDSPEEGQDLHYRVERQTLLRLPQSRAVVFTIRVMLAPLASLAARPGGLGALFEAIDGCPPALAHYKGFPDLAADLRPWREAWASGH